MKYLTFRLLTTFLLCLVWANSSRGDEDKTVLVFGDSLSASYGIEEEQGWVNLLSEKLRQAQSPYSVINASVSGETSTGGLSRLPAALAEFQPSVVILELGGNDGLRGLPLATLQSNLEEMVSLSQRAGAKVLLAGIQIPPNYGPRYTEPFYALFGDIAESEQLPFVPFLIDGIPQQPELMQNDGIHPRAEAQHMILDNVWPVLAPMLQ
ncbi:MAG TPA: arylesterase [Gammaproteobacteria bacterium]|nr:arylesterase [Gammaproteobacteria bacterium]RPG43557.1 MAG: arylesterase [Gammaproteobacteria bacterium TMED163]MAV54289.1 arylesterase [Gammaproteobacteria bacterium]HAU23515.1 arylesterase [Gammaproteobacteria bacterium]HBJ90594.1 arylesterase [Gammaproteobacteria bacterium]